MTTVPQPPAEPFPDLYRIFTDPALIQESRPTSRRKSHGHSPTWWRAFRRWPQAAWIEGDGPWALVADCGRALTVTLWATYDEAAREKAGIDRMACGGRCHRNHYIVDLELAPVLDVLGGGGQVAR